MRVRGSAPIVQRSRRAGTATLLSVGTLLTIAVMMAATAAPASAASTAPGVTTRANTALAAGAPAISAAGASATSVARAPATSVAAAAATPWFGPWFMHLTSFWTTPQGAFKPTRLAVGAEHVWVADQEAGRVVRLTLDGDVVDSWSGAGTTGGALSGPNGLALSNDGAQLFVADTGNHRVVVVSAADWTVRQEIGGGLGSALGQLSSPNDVDVWAGGIVPTSDARLFVADTGNHRIVAYTCDAAGQWQYSTAWGSQGSAAGQFQSPGGVALDHHQVKVWVADSGNDRIQVFEQDGTFLRSLGGTGTGPGQFSGPQDLAFIPSPLTLLVADSGNDRVQEWSVGFASTLTTRYRRSFGTSGTSGEGTMQNPQGVAVDKEQEGDLYVADVYNHRVQLWRRDLVGPRTYALKNAGVRRSRYARLTCKVTDSLTDRCYVQIRIYRGGARKKTLSAGWRASGKWQTIRFKCALAPGTYTWKVFAQDRAGNNQRNPIGGKKLVVGR